MNPMDDANFEGMDSKSREYLIRQILPACQPQEGSPANTFTNAEIEELQAALPSLQIGPRKSDVKVKSDKFDICHQAWPSPPVDSDKKGVFRETDAAAPPQEPPLDYYGAPNFCNKPVHLPREFRERVRSGAFVGPTNAVCPGFLQCNLVVLPAGPIAFDFLLFCQRNPKACPLIEVVDDGFCPTGVAPGADLRTDVPMYSIYENGKFVKDVKDASPFWPEKAVAFLIGCSFSYDGALMDASIPLRSAEQARNVPMYSSNIKCRPAGKLSGNMVVSMKPIPALKVSKHIEITSQYSHAHGGPVCVCHGQAIGVHNLEKPDWGDPVDMKPGDVPIFHACGVTPQNVLMESKVPFAITHKAGHMFVTDMPSDLNC